MGKDETSGKACVVKGLEYHRKKETETVLVRSHGRFSAGGRPGQIYVV